MVTGVPGSSCDPVGLMIVPRCNITRSTEPRLSRTVKLNLPSIEATTPPTISVATDVAWGCGSARAAAGRTSAATIRLELMSRFMDLAYSPRTCLSKQIFLGAGKVALIGDCSDKRD